MIVRAEARERFAVTPEALWPLVADTERLNRVLGLLPVRYETTLVGGKPALLGEFRWAGLSLARWIEYPFEWEAPYRHSVRREYLGGLLRQAAIGVELNRVDGGTEVHPWITIEARNPLGAAAARWGAAPRWTRGLLQQCRQFEQYLLGQSGSAFPQLRPRERVATARLDALADTLVRGGQDPALVTCLRRHLAEAPDVDVSSMRPFELADRWGADRRAVLSLCLYATEAGLLQMNWHVLCPNCRVSKADYRHLQALQDTAHCETCQIRFAVDFDRLVEVRFDPAPAIRAVQRETYCLAGPWSAPHVLTQAVAKPGVPLELRARLQPGTYRLRSLRGHCATIRARADGAPTATFALASDTLLPAEAVLDAGAVAVAVANDTGDEALILLERADWVDTAATGALVGTVSAFRTLFSAEVLAPGLEVRVQRLAFLFTDLAGSTALYERVGEARAFALVQEHFGILARAVDAHRGAVVKTIGDAVMAVFPTALDALEAAVAIQREIRALDGRGAVDPARLVRVGVHAGPCVAVTLNDRLDYFGTTLNTAARVEHESAGGEIVISAAVYDDAEAAARLTALPVDVEPYETRLRGINEPVRLYRLRPRWDGVAAPAGGAPASSALPAG